jgi:hypothetical protein
MAWFLPVGILIGVLGTRTALKSRRLDAKDPAWWLLLTLAWLPTLCWGMAQLIAQW